MSAITHIFALMLENRSFDSVFGLANLSGQSPDGTPTSANGLLVKAVTNVGRGGTLYRLREGSPYFLSFDPGHEFTDSCVQLCGPAVASTTAVQKDSLVLGAGGYPPLAPDWSKTGFAATYEDVNGIIADAFSAFTPDQLPVLTFLASQFGVCDNWFASVPGPTWPNRFFAVAGTSSGLDHTPSSAQVLEAVALNEPIFTFANGTVFSKLPPSDWLIVRGDVAQTRCIYGMHNQRNRFSTMENFIAQVSDGSLLERFIFIEPEYDALNDFRNGNSMHPAGDVRRGEALVKSLYDAISASKFWPNSLFLITFDEHGGFFDHVRSPPAVPPGAQENPRLKEHNFSFDRLGVRVPALVISPHVPAGTIDHTLYDHTSLLKTVDKVFRLGGALNLTARVRAANDFTKMLALTTAREDVPLCPSPVEIGDERPSSSGAARSKHPFLPLYARG
jgi:phospholipase C